MVIKHLCIVLVLGLVGCGAVTEFARRSDVSLEAVARNAATDPSERATTVKVTLHGNNRDILAAYKNALEFTLDQLGLKKK